MDLYLTFSIAHSIARGHFFSCAVHTVDITFTAAGVRFNGRIFHLAEINIHIAAACLDHHCLRSAAATHLHVAAARF